MAKNLPAIQHRPQGQVQSPWKRMHSTWWRGSKKNFRQFSQYEHDGPFNEQVLIRMHGRIHYLTCHAPQPVPGRNKQMQLRWNERLPRRNHRLPTSYHNRYTIDRFI